MATQQTAPTHYLEANGTNFAYRVIGNGTQASGNPPLLMLNHIRSTIDLWDPYLINNLTATGRQLITYDYSGLGHSGGPVQTSIKGFASNVIAFLHAFLLMQNLHDPVDVLGFSLGGYVAQQLVLDAPDLVHRLVLSGTGPSLGPHLNRPEADIQSFVFSDPASASEANSGFFPSVVSDLGAAWLNRSFSGRAGVAGKNGEPPIAGFTVNPQLQNLTEAYLKWDSDPLPYSLLASVQKDVLVTIGQNDLVIPSQNGYALARQLPRASLVQYPTSGHGHLFQYPAIAAQQIGAFLDGKNWPLSPFSAGTIPSNATST